MMFKRRVEELQRRMAEAGVSAALITHIIDVYYFTGSGNRAMLIVPVDRDPVMLVQVGFERAKRDSWVKDIRRGFGTSDLKKLLEELGLDKGVLGVNMDVISANLYLKLTSLLKDVRFTDLSPTILDIRAVKDEEEVKLIEKATDISRIGHRRVEEVLEPGITEVELSTEVEYALRKAGHDGFIRHRTWKFNAYGVIGPSGPNLGVITGPGAITITGPGTSSALPYGASNRRIERGDMVLIDFVTSYGGYHCDEARMYAVGEVDEKQLRSFKLVKEAEEKALETIKPGKLVSDLYWAARRVFEREGLLDYFAAYAEYSQYTYLGHGIGLEVVEEPSITPHNNKPLRPGMTLCLEPKLIAPHWGASFEDTVLVAEDGPQVLTKSPRELIYV